MSRIVQVANFVAPASGGIRTVLANLAVGYVEHGHEVVQLVPGAHTAAQDMPWGRRIVLESVSVPRTGYRVVTAGRVRTALDRIAPDHLEVHDRTTLRSLGTWARAAGIRASVISHERLDSLLTHWTHAPRLSRRIADGSNRALARAFDSVICTTAWAAEEFARLGATNTHVVPLGVDTDTFAPHRADPALRTRLAFSDETLVVLVSRLSPEKRPALAIDAIAELVGRGERVRLVVAGDGPLMARLRAQARDLPVRFLGHVDGPERVAALQASADVLLAPGPVETFGLAALEALACGTPIVANAFSALPDVVGAAGVAAEPTPAGFADAVHRLIARPEPQRRESARAHAIRFSWARTVAGFLAVHGERVGDSTQPHARQR